MSSGPLGARAIFLLWLLGTAVALPWIGADAVYDDRGIVVANPLARRPVDVTGIFSSSYWQGARAHSAAREYRPLTILSFALVEPLGIAGQRAVNAGLHGTVVALAALIATGLGFSRRSAVLAAALFALQPVHAEVLGTLVGRGELLATCCVLAGWRSHLAGRHWLAAGFATAGLLTKESSIVLLAFLPLGDLLRGLRREQLPGYATVALGVAVALVLRVVALGGLLVDAPIAAVDNPLVALTTLGRVLSGLSSFGQAMLLTLLPVDLVPDRSPLAWQIASIRDLRWLAGPALFLGAALIARRRPFVTLALAIFLLPLVPVANVLFPVGTALAERLLYLPSLGICLLLSMLIERAGRDHARAARGVACAVLLLYGAGFTGAMGPYRSELALWTRVVERIPDHPKGARNLAVALNEAGRSADAETVLRDGLERIPEHAARHQVLADTLAMADRLEDAIEAASTAVELDPDRRSYRLTLGGLLYDAERRQEALQSYRAIVTRWPDSAEAWWYLGRLEEREGDVAAAHAAYINAARLYGAGTEWGARARTHAARLSP